MPYDDSCEEHHYTTYGTIAALLCAFFSGLNVVAIHGLSQFKREQLLFNSSIAGFVITLFSIPFEDESLVFHNISEVNFGILILVASIALFALFMFYSGCNHLSPTIFTMIRSSEIIVTFLLQAFVNKNLPTNLTIMGGILVIVSAVCVGLEEAVRTRVPSNTLKKIL